MPVVAGRLLSFKGLSTGFGWHGACPELRGDHAVSKEAQQWNLKGVTITAARRAGWF